MNETEFEETHRNIRIFFSIVQFLIVVYLGWVLVGIIKQYRQNKKWKIWYSAHCFLFSGVILREVCLLNHVFSGKVFVSTVFGFFGSILMLSWFQQITYLWVVFVKVYFSTFEDFASKKKSYLNLKVLKIIFFAFEFFFVCLIGYFIISIAVKIDEESKTQLSIEIEDTWGNITVSKDNFNKKWTTW
ncbi:hypothetical protein M0813_18768 [Anaeramoeba flamelloides]|uniref:Uncharacterized protein n=1 Tax=Anaeramoeba flamelloides TaxID=1746091 RepID=A0ABQ8YRR6_9EUKA|nr:hypothetical protein M0813_18768 [Anaeramoeba flamelloides]